MFNTGKCPNSECQKPITNVLAERIRVTGIGQPTWTGLSLLCPSCRTVLGASIDPIAVKADIVNEITSAFRDSI